MSVNKNLHFLWSKRSPTYALAAQNCESRARATDRLMTVLKDNDPRVRAAAAKGLGHTKDARAAAPLAGALEDREAEVRESASMALQALGAVAVDPLLAVLERGGGGRATAASLLGYLRDQRAVEPLQRALADKNPEVQSNAIRALGELADPRSVGVLAAVVEDKHASWRTLAAAALAGINDPGVGQVLNAALRNKDLPVVSAACRYYIRKGDHAAVGVLIEALHADININLAEDLLNSGHPMLADAARKWAREMGMTIEVRAPFLGGPARWGNSR
jgi:HEAT repeat protein